MSLVALIHTVPTVYLTFGARIVEALPGTKVTNIVDEFLASDPADKGVFTAINKGRLFSIVKTAEATGADAIVTTCSTLSPVIEEIRSFISTPIVTIDGLMLNLAVDLGSRIAVVATASSTLVPTLSKLENVAKAQDKKIFVTELLCPEAYVAIKARDQETHDREILSRIQEVLDHDVIILAQASMAHLEKQVLELSGRIVLSSPRLCIQELSEIVAQSTANPKNKSVN